MIYRHHGSWTVYLGDSSDVLESFKDHSFDSMVCDPPAGIGHLKKSWDRGGGEWVAWLSSIFRKCLRVLKPGSHVAVWAYPRTSDLTASALRGAGFEIVQQVSNNLGRGCCNGNVDVAKAVESYLLFGNSSCNTWRRLRGKRRPGSEKNKFGRNKTNVFHGDRPKEYEGTGAFDLDPQTEEGKRWLGWGTFIMPIHEVWWIARVPLAEKTVAEQVLATGTGALNLAPCRIDGKWPPSMVSFPPASAKERELGCESLQAVSMRRVNGGGGLECDVKWRPVTRHNTHPTVKSLAICEWFIRLTTPSGGIVLDPFAGSGTTLAAAAVMGFRSVGIELVPRHCAESAARCRYWEAQRGILPAVHGRDAKAPKRKKGGDTVPGVRGELVDCKGIPLLGVGNKFFDPDDDCMPIVLVRPARIVRDPDVQVCAEEVKE